MGQYGYKSGMNTSEKLMIAIMRISELYKKECSLIFVNFGLTFSQYTVLRVLEGSEKGQNTMSNVSRVMLVSGANITGIAKRLERDGFILRKSIPQDDRVTLLEITPKGKQTLKNIEKQKNNILEKYLVDYSIEAKQEMLSNLKKCLNRMKSG